MRPLTMPVCAGTLRRMARLKVAGTLAVALVMSLAGPTWAVNPGDIVLTDQWHGLFFAEQTSGNLHHFGPPSTAVSEGLGGVATDASGNIYALLAYAGVVFRIDATSGQYTTVTSGGYLQYPNSICMLPGGDVLVTDHGSAGGVIRVNPGGAQTLLHPGPAYASTASGAGVVHVALPDPNRVVEPACRLYRIDPATGDTVRTSNTYFHCSCEMATEASGNLIITQPAYQSVQRVYPSLGGAVQVVSSGGQLVEPNGVTVEADGTIVVADVHGLPGCNPAGGPESCEGLLYRIDPVSGTQTVLSQDTAWRLGGIDVYRGPPATTPARKATWGRVKAIYR